MSRRDANEKPGSQKAAPADRVGAPAKSATPAAPDSPPAAQPPAGPPVAAAGEEAPAVMPPGEYSAEELADTVEELQPEEDLSDLPEALQIAIPAFGLKREHVLGHRLTEDGVVIITRGGRKLRWPGDEQKAAALEPQEKDGIPRKEWPRFFALDSGRPRR